MSLCRLMFYRYSVIYAYLYYDGGKQRTLLVMPLLFGKQNVLMFSCLSRAVASLIVGGGADIRVHTP